MSNSTLAMHSWMATYKGEGPLKAMYVSQNQIVIRAVGRSDQTFMKTDDLPAGLYHDVFGTLNGRSLPDGSILYGCTCNLSIKLDEVALEFDESFPLAAFEDIELCIRARKQGIQLNYEPAAIVEHVYDTSLQGLFR